MRDNLLPAVTVFLNEKSVVVDFEITEKSCWPPGPIRLYIRNSDPLSINSRS